MVTSYRVSNKQSRRASRNNQTNSGRFKLKCPISKYSEDLNIFKNEVKVAPILLNFMKSESHPYEVT